MGRIVRQVSEHTTRYYWYPGDKKEWVRAGIAVGAGLAASVAVWVLFRTGLSATVAGTSVTAGVAGANFGRRDARALAGFPDLSGKAARRTAIVHTGRAAWRAVAEGIGGAGAAVLIANLPARGVGANWLLPMVPAVVGALAHQGGMLYERLGHPEAAVAAPARAVATPARGVVHMTGARPPARLKVWSEPTG
jgi:hypothetical protein